MTKTQNKIPSRLNPHSLQAIQPTSEREPSKRESNQGRVGMMGEVKRGMPHGCFKMKSVIVMEPIPIFFPNNPLPYFL